MNKRVFLLLAPGFEEVEAVTPLDLLRRAGLEVTSLGLGSRNITGSHKIEVKADLCLGEEEGLADAIVVPGGKGSEFIAANEEACKLILEHEKAGKLLAAICAAPAAVLAPLGLLKDHRYTCFPGWETSVREGEFVGGPCVVDGLLITAKGVGAAADFSEAIIAKLLGAEKAKEIHHQTVQKN